MSSVLSQPAGFKSYLLSALFAVRGLDCQRGVDGRQGAFE
jgi:hypothetical protein